MIKPTKKQKIVDKILKIIDIENIPEIAEEVFYVTDADDGQVVFSTEFSEAANEVERYLKSIENNYIEIINSYFAGMYYVMVSKKGKY